MTTDDDATAAWAGVLQVHAALVPVLDRELREKHRLPLTWYDVLLELNAARDRRLTMGQLAERSVISRTRVSRVVGELIAAGLVTRHASDADRRSAIASITPAGRSLLRSAAPTYLAGIQRHFGQHLTSAEVRCVASAMRKILSAPS